MTDEGISPAREVILLLRSVRAGSLATVDEGRPFASLVTPACAPDRSLLMLLSGLSPHTRQLRAEPACSLMLAGPPSGANPQTAPRVSLSGTAAPEPDPALKARWITLHPYAAFYAGLGDFQLWRLRPDSAQFVGGFARACRLGAADLAADEAAVTAVAAAEARVIEHCNDDHADAMDLLANHGCVPVEEAAGWRMVACDVDGCDLALGEQTRRIAWSRAVSGPGEIRAELVRLTGQARRSLLDRAVASP